MPQGLNKGGGRNRLRFQKLKNRVASSKARVDVLHKVKDLDLLDDDEPLRTGLLLPSSTGGDEGVQRCLLREHILSYLELNTSQQFQSLGKSLLPLAGSLPEVLHHLSAVVEKLSSFIKTPWGPAHDHALLLVAALARDLGPELYTRESGRHFRSLMSCLLSALDPASPENTARAFQAMAHLLNNVATPLLADLDCMKRYYGPLLGHKKDFIRRYAAEALAGLLRRLRDKALGQHVKAVIKAAAAAMAKGGALNDDALRSTTRQVDNLIEGLSLLCFTLVRGVQSQGQLHSKAHAVLRAVISQEARGQTGDVGKVQRAVSRGMLTYTCQHVKPVHAGALWAEVIRAVREAWDAHMQECKRSNSGGGGRGRGGGGGGGGGDISGGGDSSTGGGGRKKRGAMETHTSTSAVSGAAKGRVSDGSSKGAQGTDDMSLVGGKEGTAVLRVEGDGLERTLQMLALLLQHRRGWLLSDRDVRNTCSGQLAPLISAMASPTWYGTLPQEAQLELLSVLGALWEARGRVGAEGRRVAVGKGEKRMGGRGARRRRGGGRRDDDDDEDSIEEVEDDEESSEDVEDGDDELGDDDDDDDDDDDAEGLMEYETEAQPGRRANIKGTNPLLSALSSALAYVLGPDSGGDTEATGRLAGRVLLSMSQPRAHRTYTHADTYMHSKGLARAAVNAVLRRVVSPLCPYASRRDLLRAMVCGGDGATAATGDGGAGDHIGTATTPSLLSHAERSLMVALGEDLLRRAQGHSPEALVAMRCLPHVVQVAANEELTDSALGVVRGLCGVEGGVDGMETRTPTASGMDTDVSAAAAAGVRRGVEGEAVSDERGLVDRLRGGQAAVAMCRLWSSPGVAEPEGARGKLIEHLLHRLQTHPSSLTTLHALTHALAHPDTHLDPGTLLRVLTPNLRSPNKPLRMATLRLLTRLRVLDYLPPTDRHTTLVGPCHALQLMLEIEETPITATAERGLAMTLGKLEVMARSGRMPVAYRLPAAVHCLGLLHVKYAELWKLASQTFSMLSQCLTTARDVADLWGHFTAMWLHADQRLVRQQSAAGGGDRSSSHQPPPSSSTSTPPTTAHDTDDAAFAADASDQDADMRVLLDAERGVWGVDDCARYDVVKFVLEAVSGGGGAADESVLTALQTATDPLTVQTHMLQTLKKAGSLLGRRSMDLASMFLVFLHRQYFSVFSDDPDARELKPEIEKVLAGLSGRGGGGDGVTAAIAADGSGGGLGANGGDGGGRKKRVRGGTGDAAAAAAEAKEEQEVVKVSSKKRRKSNGRNANTTAAAVDSSGTGEMMSRHEHASAATAEGPTQRPLVDGELSVDGMGVEGTIEPKAARTKLMAFLEVLVVAKTPQDDDSQRLLTRTYTCFLSRPDSGVARSALDCLLAPRPPHLVPYADTLKNLLDDRQIRDEMVRFSVANSIQPEHRSAVVPVLVRVLFGRFVVKGGGKQKGKSARDSPAARRAAIVSFLAGAQGVDEFGEFVSLMVRPFVLDPTRPFTAPDNLDAAAASPGRRLGFLHLLRSVIRQMGFHVLPFVRVFVDLVLGCMALGYGEGGGRGGGGGEAEGTGDGEVGADQAEGRGMGDAGDDGQEGEEEDDAAAEADDDKLMKDGVEAGADDGGGEEDVDVDVDVGGYEGEGKRALGNLRVLSTKALTDVMTQFAEAYDFAHVSQELWGILGTSVQHLPSMCSSSPRPPTMLDLILTLTTHGDTLLSVYTHHAHAITPKLITSLSVSGKGPATPVAGQVLSILEHLMDDADASLLLPHLSALVSSLHTRFDALSHDTHTHTPVYKGGRKGGRGPGGDPLMERALSLLCRLGQLAARRADAGIDTPDPEALTQLFGGLLLPKLRTRTMREGTKRLVLGSYAALVGHAKEARKDVMLLCKLLGPQGLSVGFSPTNCKDGAEGPLRDTLVAALEAVASRDELKDLRPAVQVLRELNAMDDTHIEGRDMGRIMPQWTRFSEDDSWRKLLVGEAHGMALALVPLVFHALASLYDEEVVIRMSASASLRALIRCAAKGDEASWSWVIEAALLPCLRSGMYQARDVVRTGYVAVLAELVRCCAHSPPPPPTDVAHPGTGAASVPPPSDANGFDSVSAPDSSAAPATATVDTQNTRGAHTAGGWMGRPEWRTKLHGDLSCLLRDDDVEADFFHNIVHIQVHRRTRALQRMRKVLSSLPVPTGSSTPAQTPPSSIISSSSLVHILLPLSSQPLLSPEPPSAPGASQKAQDPSLVHESALATAEVVRRVSWSHYHHLVKKFLRVLKQPGNTSARDKALVNGLCMTLDAFHFPMEDVVVEVVKEMEEQEEDAEEEEDDEGDGDEELVEKEGQTSTDGADGEAMDVDGPSSSTMPPASTTLTDSTPTAGSNAGPTTTPAMRSGDGTMTAAVRGRSVVWRAVTSHLIPSLRKLLLRPAKDKTGTRITILRSPLALALLKLIRLLPPASFHPHLTRLLMTVCGELRSRESDARDAARDVLAKMSQALGTEHLGQIIRELKAALREGYQMHVRVFTLHTVLRAVSEVYTPPTTAPSHPVPGIPSLDPHTGSMDRDVSSGDVDVSAMERGGQKGDGVRAYDGPVVPPFDACVREIVDVLTEDMFGEAQTAKEADAEVKHTLIKEAKGQKSLDAIELVGRMLLFRPTYALAAPHDPPSVSSLHALISPFLWQLHDSESPRLHGRVNLALQRVVAGLVSNPSVKPDELLLYVYGLISPFVRPVKQGGPGDEIDVGKEDEYYSSSSEDEDRLQVGWDWEERKADEDEEDAEGATTTTRGRTSKGGRQGKKKGNSNGFVTWLPVDSSLKLAVDARRVRLQAIREEARVLDGRNAPKLTGFGRHGSKARKAEGGMFGDPASLASGILGLRLLHSYLKKAHAGKPLGTSSVLTNGGSTTAGAGDDNDDTTDGVMVASVTTDAASLTALLDPYVELLSKCIRRKVNDAIVLLALKCVLLLLQRHVTRLPSLPYHSPRLARSVVGLLSRAGGPANAKDQMVQACLQTLTLLLTPRRPPSSSSTEPHAPPHKDPLPLSTDALRALVSLLRSAALDYDHQQAPLALVKALVARKAMVPEMYDLMDRLLGLAVTARRATVRQMCTQAVVIFLLNYPLDAKKASTYIAQAVRNLGYEYEDGRASAISVLQVLTARLPVPVLDEHAQTLFLPLTIRLVNDSSPKVRQAAADALAGLLRRVSGDVYHQLLEYAVKWMSGGPSTAQIAALARAAAQASGIFADARPDLFKRGAHLGPAMLRLLGSTLHTTDTTESDPSAINDPKERQGEVVLPWELVYHCLVSVERIYEKLPGMVEPFWASDEGLSCLCSCSELLVYKHAWVRLAAGRVIGRYLDRRDPASAAKDPWLNRSVEARSLVRRLCVQIDRPSVHPDLALRAVKSLVFVAGAAGRGLRCEMGDGGAGEEGGEGVAEEVSEGDEEKDVEEGQSGGADAEENRGGGGSGDVLSWMFHRLSYMARRKGEDRRCAVFRFFAAFASLETRIEIVQRFLPHMLSPLYRATTDGQGEPSEHGNNASELAGEVMVLIEEKVGSRVFVEVLAAVQKRAADKRESRKKARAIEAVTDPEAAAKRRMENNLRKRRGGGGGRGRGGGGGGERGRGKRKGAPGDRGDVIKRNRVAAHVADPDQGM